MVMVRRIDQRWVAMVSWLVIVFINFLQLVYVKYSVPGKFEVQDVLYYPLTSLVIGWLLIYSLLLPIFKKIRTLKIGFQIPLFILHGLVYTSIYIVFIFFQISWWSENLDMTSFSSSVHRFFYTDFHNIAKNYFFLLAIYLAVEFVNKRSETLSRQKELEYQLKEVKLQAIESKLHPHFLFNALNGIMSLIIENPKKAENALVELSDLLRFTLESNLQDPVTLSSELELLEKYVSIEKMRYEDQLEVSISIEDDVDINRPIIPPLILQPILENAIVHGFKGLSSTLQIKVAVSKTGIRIKNNGSHLKEDINHHTGLRIVEQRLSYHFDEEVELKLFQYDGWVICELNGLNL